MLTPKHVMRVARLMAQTAEYRRMYYPLPPRKPMEVNDGSGLDALMKIESDSDTIAAWSESKKKDFCNLFQTRATDAATILKLTAEEIFGAALRRHFVPSADSFRERTFKGRGSVSYQTKQGRNFSELKRIADERAKVIIRELPIARKAVEVIDADTAAMMLEVEQINEKLPPLQEELEGFDEEIRLSDLPQDQTIGWLRKHIASEVKKRQDLTKKVNELIARGRSLEETIAKRLYKGLPGLKEAVSKVVDAHLQRADHLGTVSRRVEERVLYGDSQAAMEMLKSFEEDEIKVSEDVRAELREAVESLGISKKKKKASRKKLKS